MPGEERGGDLACIYARGNTGTEACTSHGGIWRARLISAGFDIDQCRLGFEPIYCSNTLPDCSVFSTSYKALGCRVFNVYTVYNVSTRFLIRFEFKFFLHHAATFT